MRAIRDVVKRKLSPQILAGLEAGIIAYNRDDSLAVLDRGGPITKRDEELRF
jgi:hypothetical protein